MKPITPNGGTTKGFVSLAAINAKRIRPGSFRMVNADASCGVVGIRTGNTYEERRNGK